MIELRVPMDLLSRMRADLIRPHPFADERVGLLATVSVDSGFAGTVVLARDYISIPDDGYVEDSSVGARINTGTVRMAVKLAHAGQASKLGVLHVHLHPHSGLPVLSGTDRREIPRFVQGLVNVSTVGAHGFVVLSDDAAVASFRLAGSTALVSADVVIGVGNPMTFAFLDERAELDGPAHCDRFERQGFLGPNAQKLFSHARVGVIGLGGGGSHVVQQLAHLGFARLCGMDGDVVEESNLNRLVSARVADVAEKLPKVAVARRVVDGLGIGRECVFFEGRWQDRAALLVGCDIVVGCVDSFSQRRELEAACRRHLIPYLDIGMDVHQVGDEASRMAGQVILSMPGEACMFCLGFLTEDRLAQEAARYGAAGDRPQVVWPNGVLASTVVGHVAALLTGWSDRCVPRYLSYDAGSGEIRPHPRLAYVNAGKCPHYPLTEIGEPVFEVVANPAKAAGKKRSRK
jgi:hypothetical protein